MSFAIPPDSKIEFQLMTDTWNLIEEEYVDQEEVHPRSMAYNAIRGMVQTLGDAGHTRFLDPEIAERHANQIAGEFEGIGVYVEVKDGRVVIITPTDGQPADRASLEGVEVITEVNGQDALQLPPSEVINHILGPAGSEVTLTILDPDLDETRTVTIERAEIDIDLVTWTPLPAAGVAYVRISAFSDGVSDDLGQTLERIQKEGVKGLILDLRSNPGGLLSEAINVSRQFLENGKVLLTRNAERETDSISVNKRIESTKIPLVVLVNGGTASAAEIVTGALQDHDRGKILGTTTTGAGTVLNRFKLSDGSFLLLAVEEWLTPDGRVIWQKGLTPDLEVKLPSDVDPSFRLFKSDFSEEDIESSEDIQLKKAMKFLMEAIRE